MPDITDKYPTASEYSAQVHAYFGSKLPRITAREVLNELPKRCGAGQQYTTFPNEISDADIAILEGEGLVVTRNTVHSENRDGDSDMYIGFQVALNELAVAKAMVISEKETNGIDSGGGPTPVQRMILKLVFLVTNIRSTGQYLQMTELEFLDKSGNTLGVSGSSAYIGSTSTPVTYAGSNEKSDNLFDGSDNTKMCCNWPSSGVRIEITLDNPIDLAEIDKYRYMTANDFPDRDPTSWVLSAVTDFGVTLDIDTQIGFSVPSARKSWTDYCELSE